MTLSVWGWGAADAARLVDVEGPASGGAKPKPEPEPEVPARKPTRAGISYEPNRRSRNVGVKKRVGKHGVGLTMDGVRRSS